MNVILGDCREIIASMPPESVDCIVTDPPYGDTPLAWDRKVRGWADLCLRVLKPHGSLWCFGSLRFFMEHGGEFSSWKLAQDVVWEKHNGSGFDADRFKRVHELAAHFYPADRKWAEVYRSPQFVAGEARPTATIGARGRLSTRGDIRTAGYEYTDQRMMRSVMAVRSCHGKAAHPTQKPTELLEPLIRYSCPPGGTVLDCFAGSGSTGIAARIAGCRSTLIEVDPEYAAVAQRRLDEFAPLLAGLET